MSGSYIFNYFLKIVFIDLFIWQEVGGALCMIVCMQRPEENLWEFGLLFHHVVPKVGTRVFMLGVSHVLFVYAHVFSEEERVRGFHKILVVGPGGGGACL